MTLRLNEECGKEINDKEKKQREPMPPEKKKKLTIIGVAALGVLVIASILVWYFAVIVPRNEAYVIYSDSIKTYNEYIAVYNTNVEAYNNVANKIIAENDKIQGIVDEAQDLIDCEDTPYEQDVLADLNNTLKNTRNIIAKDPDIYEKKNSIEINEDLAKAFVKKIKSENDVVCRERDALDILIKKVDTEAKNLVVPDYNNEIARIKKETSALKDSYAIQKQIINPTQDFVYKKLCKVKSIANIACVTEETDPYRQLNKDGSYNAILFFSSPLLGAEGVTGDAIIDEGTDCGGCVEVFPTVKSATARNDYLACFDGSFIDPGKHQLLGTMVLRISAELPASKQDVFMNELVEALTSLD